MPKVPADQDRELWPAPSLFRAFILVFQVRPRGGGVGKRLSAIAGFVFSNPPTSSLLVKDSILTVGPAGESDSPRNHSRRSEHRHHLVGELRGMRTFEKFATKPSFRITLSGAAALSTETHAAAWYLLVSLSSSGTVRSMG